MIVSESTPRTIAWRSSSILSLSPLTKIVHPVSSSSFLSYDPFGPITMPTKFIVFEVGILTFLISLEVYVRISIGSIASYFQ